MQQKAQPLFLTFVLGILLSISLNAVALPQDLDRTYASSEKIKIETVDISPAPPLPPRSRSSAFFYSYRQSLTLRAGALYATRAEDDKNLHTLIGVQYTFPIDLKPHEAGADLASDGSGILHFARKFVYSRDRFRPYSKLGAGLRIVPSERLTSLLKHKNYQVRAAIGFEQLTRRPMSLRMELEVMASLRSTQSAATVGYVWAW